MTARRPSPWRRSTDRPAQLDLGERYLDVVRLTRCLPAFDALRALGWESDDILQEVLVRLVARQSGRSRYNPRRSGLGKYVTVFAQSVLLNLLEGERRQKRARQQVGMPPLVEHRDRPGPTDAATVAVGDFRHPVEDVDPLVDLEASW